MFMRTTPTQVRFCFFLFIYLFLTYFLENNSFLYFVLSPPFFSFFLTGKDLVSCEVSSCKKKNKNKRKILLV